MRLAAALVAAAALAAGCGTATTFAYRGTTPTVARQLMIDYLGSRHLDWRWVACLYTGRQFVGAPIVRCNVNFGDPHIEAYCAVFLQGELATQFERPELRCARKRDSDGSPIG